MLQGRAPWKLETFHVASAYCRLPPCRPYLCAVYRFCVHLSCCCVMLVRACLMRGLVTIYFGINLESCSRPTERTMLKHTDGSEAKEKARQWKRAQPNSRKKEKHPAFNNKNRQNARRVTTSSFLFLKLPVLHINLLADSVCIVQGNVGDACWINQMTSAALA